MSIINEMIKSKHKFPPANNSKDPYIASVSDTSFKLGSMNPTVIALSSCIALLIASSTYFVYHHYQNKIKQKSTIVKIEHPKNSLTLPKTTQTASQTKNNLKHQTSKTESASNQSPTAIIQDPTLSQTTHHSSSNTNHTPPNNAVNVQSKPMLAIDVSDGEKFYSERFLEIQEGRLFKAMIALNNVSANEDLFVSTVIRLSSSLNEKKKFSESQTLVKSGLDHYPQKLSLITQLASSYMAANQYAKGVEILEKYTPDFESHPDYYSLLAYSYLKTNRVRESINIYKQLVLFDPTNAPWWIGLGIAYQSHSNPKNALDAFRHALRVSKEHAPYIEYIEKQISEISKDYII